MRIITYGLVAQHNLGCPSILHGIRELLTSIYGSDMELINLQIGPVEEYAVSDMGFQTRSMEVYRAVDFAKAAFLGKSWSGEHGLSLPEVVELIKSADLVINLFGICFCERLTGDAPHPSLYKLYGMLRFPLSYFAKKHRVRSVKSAASYGPSKGAYNRKLAKYCCSSLFDLVVAREEKSYQFLLDCGVSAHKIRLSPDIANLMPVQKTVSYPRTTVGISISHQIIRQWTSAESYVTCITQLCRHLCSLHGVSVQLIPNEVGPTAPYNDFDVAEDCMEALRGENLPVEILDVRRMCSSDLKAHIAACEAVVASRYHSCVAALSSGVPLLVLGWHYKYEELMHWYGQDAWMLSEDNCDSKKLISTFDRFWAQRETSRQEIMRQKPVVQEAVLSVGREMLGVKDHD